MIVAVVPIVADMKKVLVLCTGNSCRSQMAEAYLRLYAGEKADIYSAGIEAHGLNPNAVESMLRDGIDISGHTSDVVNSFDGIAFDHVITVCDHAAEVCPHFGNALSTHHHNFPDPAKFKGTPEETKAEFNRVRDMIKAYCSDFAIKYLI